MLTALLDTCTLWPSVQRDFLLSLAAQGIYRPIWSSEILEELFEVEVRKLISNNVAHAQARSLRLIDNMRKAFPDSEIRNASKLQPVGLPDAADEHVVAGALLGGASCIVTHNIRDFPRAFLPGHLAVVLPEDFAQEVVSMDLVGAGCAVMSMSGRMVNPPMAPAQLLDYLASRYRMSAVRDLLWML